MSASSEEWRTAAELLVVALLRQRRLEAVDAVEVVLERALVASGDHEDVLQARRHGLFDDVLDGGFVDDRKHLLRRRLGRGEESSSQAGYGDHGLANCASRD